MRSLACCVLSRLCRGVAARKLAMSPTLTALLRGTFAKQQRSSLSHAARTFTAGLFSASMAPSTVARSNFGTFGLEPLRRDAVDGA